MIKNETNIYAYPEDVEEFDREDLSASLSQTSQLLVESFETNLSKKKPNVLLYPYHFVSILPILAYRTVKQTNKDVIIISSNDNIKQHLKNYELLSQPDGQYIFKFCIPIEIIDGQSEVKVYSRRMGNKQKKLNSEYLLGISSLPEMRKIIFCDYMYLSEAMSQEQKTFFPDLNKAMSCKIDVGTIFFENADGILRSHQSCNDFCSWIKEYSKQDHNVLIHLNDPYAPVGEVLTKSIEGEFLDYNHYYIREAIKVTNKIKSEKYDIVPKNISNPNIKIITSIEIPNADSLIEELNNIRKSIYLTKIDLPIHFRSLFNLKELLLKLSVHPSLFKFAIVNKEGNFIHSTIDHYLSILKEDINEVHNDVKGLLKQYISTLNTLYSQLKETQRYGEAQTYSTECKNSFLLKYLIELDKTRNNGNINILTYSRNEVSILSENIELLNLKNIEVEVYYIRNAVRDCDLSSLAIICGTPSKKSEFVRIANAFREVRIISYSGKESDTCSKVIDKVGGKEYLKRAVKHNQNTKNSIKEKDNNFKFIEQIEEESEKEIIEDDVISTESNVEIDLDPIEFERRINEYNISRSAGPNPENSNAVMLEHITTKQTFPIYCGSSTQFIVVDKEGNYFSEPFEDLKVGDTIMRFGPSEKDDILELISEMYGLGDDVDTDIIRLWKNSFLEGITNLRKKLGKDNYRLASVNRIYDEYKQCCKESNVNPKTYVTFVGWVQDKRIGPEDVEDVKVLGLLGNFPNIKNEYNYIHDQMKLIRRGHVQIGHKISKIIKNILAKKETKSLNYQEKMLHDRIQLFKVISLINKEQKS